MGAYATDILCQGKTNRVVGYQHGEFVDFDIEEALAMKKDIPEYPFEVSKLLSK
jgi:6-phosphofructokinase 1